MLCKSPVPAINSRCGWSPPSNAGCEKAMMPSFAQAGVIYLNNMRFLNLSQPRVDLRRRCATDLHQSTGQLRHSLRTIWISLDYDGERCWCGLPSSTLHRTGQDSQGSIGAMTTILGISAYYHDSAACLVRDGTILAAAQEERFTRKKQDPGFPGHAIRYCLQEAAVCCQGPPLHCLL